MISRYANSPRSWAPHHDGHFVEVVMRRPVFWFNQPYATKQVVSGETMPILAFERYGGDATAYWRIADMNPQVACPDDLEPGEVVHLPIIEL
jgi:hypothetical protein